MQGAIRPPGAAVEAPGAGIAAEAVGAPGIASRPRGGGNRTFGTDAAPGARRTCVSVAADRRESAACPLLERRRAQCCCNERAEMILIVIRGVYVELRRDGQAAGREISHHRPVSGNGAAVSVTDIPAPAANLDGKAIAHVGRSGRHGSEQVL